MCGQERVDFVKMLTDPQDQFPSVGERFLADIKDLAKHVQVSGHILRSAGALLKIVTEEKLQGQFPRFTT
jgi:hypothetical protein